VCTECVLEQYLDLSEMAESLMGYGGYGWT
jgi:hypothetical protein